MLWDRFKKGFDAWETTTAARLDKALKSPVVLGPIGAALSIAMKVKTRADVAKTSFWSGLGLPTKRDQERSLHALNQLESRLMDLEERLREKK
ncbi:MAG: hypothetical protein ABJE95_07545 [Byssovorax sp.]